MKKVVKTLKVIKVDCGLQTVVLRILEDAVKGKPAAMKEIWDRLDGKVRQTDGVQTDGAELQPVSGPIEFVISYEERQKEKQNAIIVEENGIKKKLS